MNFCTVRNIDIFQDLIILHVTRQHLFTFEPNVTNKYFRRAKRLNLRISLPADITFLRKAISHSKPK